MAWNPNLDVLSGILGDARQYVDQSTREKKAASIKDLDRLYAERQLADQRDYNEEMLLEQQRIAQENAMRNLRQEILIKAGGFGGLELTPEQEGRVTGLYKEQKDAAAELAAAELADLQAATLLKGRQPAKAAGRSSGMTTAEYQRQFGRWEPQHYGPQEWQMRTAVQAQLGKLTDPKAGLMDVGLNNPAIAQSWDQVIGHKDHPWKDALGKIMGGDRAQIPLFEVTQLTTTNADHQAVKARLNEKLSIVRKIVHSEMIRQLGDLAQKYPKSDLSQFGGVADIYGGDHSEKLVERMMRDMMIDMSTGAIVMAPAGQQQQAGQQQPTGQQGSAASREAERNRRLRGR